MNKKKEVKCDVKNIKCWGVVKNTGLFEVK